jgi:hypothetical protein
MSRTAHIFKIGQEVYHHAGVFQRGKRSGPYTVVGVVRRSSGETLYRIKSSSGEQLAHETELKLVLRRKQMEE